jgi:hypothetical protein
MQGTDVGWIVVDLGGLYSIADVRLNWEKAYAASYEIQVSDDLDSWTTIRAVHGRSAPGVDDQSGLSGVGRFVRIYCTQTSAEADNYSLYDLNIYGTRVADLAAGKPTASSTVEGPNFLPANAVDADSTTRWSSGQWMQSTQTGWFSVDLGAVYNINEVRLNWETAYGADYQIQASTDGVNWTTLKDVVGNTQPGVVTFDGLSGIGRYVRIYCTKTSAGSNNYSLYDVKVYGTPLADLAAGKPATSSTIEGPGFEASRALDSNSSTRWSTGQWMQDTQVGWIAVDLGATYAISDVRLNWETAYAVDYQIQVSNDGANWTTLRSVTGRSSPGLDDQSGLSGTGRYIRIYCTRTSATAINYSLYDLQVFGVPAVGGASQAAATPAGVGSGPVAQAPLSAAASAADATVAAQPAITAEAPAASGKLPAIKRSPAVRWLHGARPRSTAPRLAHAGRTFPIAASRRRD